MLDVVVSTNCHPRTGRRIFRGFYRMAKAVIGTRVSDWPHIWTSNTVSWDDHLDRDCDRQRAFLERHPQDRIPLFMLQSA